MNYNPVEGAAGNGSSKVGLIASLALGVLCFALLVANLAVTVHVKGQLPAEQVTVTPLDMDSPPLMNLKGLKDKVEQYYYGADGELWQADLDKAQMDWEAHFEGMTFTDKDVAVFDVDETLLNNLPEIKQSGWGYCRPDWDRWIQQANQTVLEQVRSGLYMLHDKGASVLLLTGRNENQRDATVNNLRDVGIPPDMYLDLILRQPDEHDDSAVKYKSTHRAEWAAKGYNFIACFGDQYSDCEGPYVGHKIKLPNYAYYVA